MGMSLSAAAARLAREVPQAEHDIDQALIALSSLMNSMLTARNVPGVGAGTGEMAIQHVGKAIEGMVCASGELAKAHNRLRKVYEERGLGDLSDCPSASTSLSAPTRLAI